MTLRDADQDVSRPVSRQRLTPLQQVLAVAFAAVVALTTVGIVMFVRLTQIDHSYRRVVREAAISDALTSAEMLYRSNIADMAQSLAVPTGGGGTTSQPANAQNLQGADTAWATYKRLATGVTGVTGEAQLRKTAESAQRRRFSLLAPATGKTAPTDISEKIASAGATQVAAIETLRSRYARVQAHDATVTAATVAHSRRDLLVTTAVELVFLMLAFSATYASVRRRERLFRAHETERGVDADRNDLETRLARSLEMAHTEEAAYMRVARAIGEVAPGERAQVLVADSSRAHLHQVLALNLPPENSGCPVGTPRDCPAITRGQTQHFTDSDALDACPQLVDRPDGACSATCVPLSIGGKSIGVLHVIDAPRRSIDAETGTRLELISRKAGDRIGMLRAFNRSETEARSDQLTGLLNRRSLEDEVRRVVESGEPYAIAYGDLDHFKQLNDVYGHDTGDRALRLFSRVLRDSVRPRDIPARYGGEEFVVVLPDCTLTDATQVLERVRENLARAQSDASVPHFTVSFGLSDSDSGTRFEDVLKSADGRLSEAKAQGRDRVVAAVSSTQRPQPESDPSLTTIGRPVAVANESSPTQT